MMTQPEPYAVYVLNCSPTANPVERAESVLGRTPKWVYKAARFDDHYYVGASMSKYDLKNRLKTHVFCGDRAAWFTKIFRPVGLETVRWFNDAESVKAAESETAIEYRKNTESAFVYQY